LNKIMSLSPIKIVPAFLLLCFALFANAEDAALSEKFDAYIAAQMEELHISGGVLLVLKDDEIGCLKGYGVANREKNQPVDAENTYFRIGSVSKVFTATAVMKAAEDGHLDLDADVNVYLKDFKVPDYGGKPVTLRQLLTHTANFDERLLGIGKRSWRDVQPLGDYLAERLPPRVGAPGLVTNYSNHGIVLAAHIIEAATGEEFSDYIFKHILESIGIPRACVEQPFPENLRTQHAQSYQYNNGGYLPQLDWEMSSQVWPSGALALTAPQMAQYMKLQLGNGNVDGKETLRPENVQEMLKMQHKLHPNLQRGHGLAWSLRLYNGHKIAWHTGRVQRFTAQLVLVPDMRLGFFAAFNADEGDELRNGLFKIFAEHFMGPQNPADLKPLKAPQVALDKFSGMYRQTRHAKFGFEKLAMLREEQIIKPDGAGNLLQYKWGEDPAMGQTWVCIAPGLFQAKGDAEGRRMAFNTDEEGKVRYAFIELDEFTVNDAFERLAWYEGTTFQLCALALSLLLMAVMLLRTIAEKMFKRKDRTDYGHIARIAAFTSALSSALCAVFVLGVAYAVTQGDLNQFAFGLPPLITGLLALPIAAAALSCVGTPCILLLLGRRSTPFISRWHLALTQSGIWLFIALVQYWNLLGYHT